MLLVIDNYDSFTYNLVQYLGELKAHPVVYRNDQISIGNETLLFKADKCGRKLSDPKLVIATTPCVEKSVVTSQLKGRSLPVFLVSLDHVHMT